jgi:hypothetical protein
MQGRTDRATNSDTTSPTSDNSNIARGISFNADGPGFPFWATPWGWTIAPLNTWKGAMGGNGKQS